ncbi:MAG: hypothetical protein ABSG54_06275 [Terriglobia bacterium]|jgi:hypothetical protein
MRVLYRILDWAEKNQVDIFLQQQFSDVAWNAYPELRGTRKGVLISGPVSMQEFSEGLAALADHLLRAKNYHCIKWLCITNEPGWSWSSFQGPDGKPLPLAPALGAVRAGSTPSSSPMMRRRIGMRRSTCEE